LSLAVHGRLADSGLKDSSLKCIERPARNAVTRLETKIHPRLRRGCKVRGQRGFITDPAVDVESGQPEGAEAGQPRERNSG
jgi:hypothetical protein